MYLFLPGNNVDNREDCEALRDLYPADNKLMLYYKHWKEEGTIDWNAELNKIMALNISGDTYVVAKSAGCILGLKAQRLGYIDVKSFVFIGFPYYWAANRGDEVDYLLDNLKTPALFIQKEKDPTIGYEELNTLLLGKALNVSTMKYESEEEANDLHEYKDSKYLVKEIKDFFERK